MFRHQPLDQRLVGNVAFNKHRLGRHGPLESGGQAIKNDNGLMSVNKTPHHVATDIASTARHQNSHFESPNRFVLLMNYE
ncbi:hypothetical protein K32_36390 [Kaistia sp. 32K]|nr:hypothetical protein K32_36390 [Kaistia sp. 32K]